MEYTTNYNLAKPEANDQINPLSREAYNSNLDVIDEKIKEASENGGIAVQPDEPTTTVLAWIDTDEEGADFCYVGDTEPTNDGSVAVWVDTSNKAIKTLVGGAWNNVYDVATQSTNGLMSSADKSKLDKVEVRDLLWTNPNPTNEFAPQTISLNLSDYDFIEVFASGDNNNNFDLRIKIYTKSMVGSNRNLLSATRSSDRYQGMRTFDVATNGITFDVGKTTNNWTEWYTNNNWCTPQKIYGIKVG